MNPEIAYIHGAIHDGYVYSGKSKGRIAVITQKNRRWLENIKEIIEENDGRAWIFPQRDIHILETKFSHLLEKRKISSSKEKLEYVSGFFDAEGGIPKKLDARFYVQFVQKNKRELQEVANILEEFGIKCGKLHQYDQKSKCWRFFVRAESYLKFIKFVRSRHPEKQERLKSFKNQLLER
jgi:DNA-binding transcriptional regulator WhiA